LNPQLLFRKLSAVMVLLFESNIAPMEDEAPPLLEECEGSQRLRQAPRRPDLPEAFGRENLWLFKYHAETHNVNIFDRLFLVESESA
jgi:hypothetical protein